MAPEQWRGRAQSTTTDQYALAVVAYELLAGELPFKGSDVTMLRLAVMNDIPEPISTISDSANVVLRKALAKDSADRFATCRQFVAALGEVWTTVETAILEEEESVTFPLTLPSIFRWGWALVGCLLLVFLLGTIFWRQGSQNQTKSPEVVAKIGEPQPIETQAAASTPPVPTPQTTALSVMPQHRAGERMVLTIKGIEYAFRWCPPGTFMMGSAPDEADRDDDEQQHEVTLSHGFWMLETQVTQGMWVSVMGNNPSHFKGDKLPVESVSWYDCQEYITKLNDELKSRGNQSPGLKPIGGLIPAALKGFQLSLPTEAQWEYACRAGTTTAYHFGDTLTQQQANFGGSIGRTKEVGSYPANAWGLRDMHGNVWEWCSDLFEDYPSGAVTDPMGAERGLLRVLRGGA